jgi:outer membrane protein assembly factor BamB
VEALGYDVDPFLATSYERQYEVIAADSDAVCGGPGMVRVVDLDQGQVRWSHELEGSALGLAAANGRLVVSTSKGAVYCFDASAGDRSSVTANVHAKTSPAALSSAIDYAKVAEEIIEKSGVTAGICVDMGCGSGELALELVRRSQLYVIGVESDPTQVNRARQMLDHAGVYGTRISIHRGDPTRPLFPRHCANVIVSTRGLAGESDVLNDMEIDRLQRPFGGVVCIGRPGQMQVQRRGPLGGAGGWTHQNCSPANTLCSSDDLVRGPLELSWYRDGVLEIVDRHAQGPAPLFSQGCLVVQGTHGVCALDAYNGRTLWTHPIDGILADWDGVHHDVGVGDAGSNICLSDQAVFVRTDDRCLRIELDTGRRVREFKTPVDPSAKDRAWGYVAHVDGMLFGSVLNDAHTVSPRYDKIRLRTESVMFFAMDADTGQSKWQYRPKHSIRNNAIAIADDRVFLIDRLLARADRIAAPAPNGKHRPPIGPGEHPGGTLIAMDAETGSILWTNASDIFGTQIAVSEKHGVLLMYYQAVKHGFFKLPSEIGGRMAAFDAKTGARLWDIKVDHKTRPLINDEVIYAEGGAWKLKTGEAIPWKFERSYGCGQIAASTHLMLFRSATLGYLDLTRNAGTENFGGIRPSCWFNAIPAGGMVLVPDGSSKCACSYQTRAWLALQRAE